MVYNNYEMLLFRSSNMGMSDYLESGVINFLLRSNSNSFSAPSNLSIALCSGVPQDHQTGSTIPEIASGLNGVSNGYQRYNFGPPANSDWKHVNSSGYTHNLAQLSFPACTVANWGTISGVALCDKSRTQTGQVLFYGKLATSPEVVIGDTLRINIGDLDITLY
jgi:hypothetical protein